MPTAFGHYQIVSALGAGGMGEVYLATDTRLNRQVAIKVLRPGDDDTEEARRRLLHEARMVAAIDHPNVCTVFEVGTADDRPYIVMQYVRGETLLARLQRGPLGAAETSAIGSQVAAALAAAHAHGVVHRDIKPGNVMIGDGDRVTVLDFGLARTFARSTGDTQTVQSPLVAGTTSYMSPEQLRGEPLDGRSDVFSLGVMLYEMASGRRPFDRPSAAATIGAILTEPPPPLESPLQPIITRALAKPAAERFGSAAMLRDALTGAEGTATVVLPATPRTIAVAEVDPAAEKLYLRGRLLWNKRHPDAIREAITCFQEAVTLDPRYPQAYAGLADAYMLLGFLQTVPPVEVVPKAKAAARRAIELDPALPEPHASLGYLSGIFDWDWEAARRELAEAMRLDPGYPWAPHWYGLLASTLSLEDALSHVARARDLDPLSPITNIAMGIPLHLHRRYREAVMAYANVLESEAGFAPAHYYIGLSYEQLGEYDAAVTHLERSAAIGGRTSIFIGALAHCLGRSGRHDEARALAGELTERARARYVSPLNLMYVHLGLNEFDEALDELERALTEHNAALWFAPVEPRFDPFRSDARFRELLSRHGLRSDGDPRTDLP